ncbi:response regulator transcription factor [Raoultibacter massiliensis]|uniref:helix-turn-helix transcriptional regulator n=1 Tax=Raoultibacter massiliensis TaxID=1852371 RepID=UPI003A936733
MPDRVGKTRRAVTAAKFIPPLKQLVFCGFGLQTLWAACLVRQHNIDLIATDVHTVFYGFFGVFCLFLALVFAFAVRSKTERDYHIFDMSALLMMILSTYLLSDFIPLDEMLSGWIGAILGSLGFSWILMRWGQSLSALPIRKSVHCILLAYTFHFLGFALFGFLGSVASIVFLFLLSIGSFFMLRRSLTATEEVTQGAVYYDRESVGSFWQTLAAVVLYGFILGMRSEFSLMITDPIASLVCQIFASLIIVFMIVWLFGAKGNLEFSRIFQLLLIIIATGFFLYPFAEGFQRELIASLFVVGVGLIYMLMWLGLVDIIRHSRFHPFVVIGVWGACYGLPRPLATLAADLYPIAGFAGNEDYLTTLSLMLVYGIILCTAFLLGSRPHGQRPLLSSLSAPLPLPELFGRIDERCCEVGKSHGLTAREIEVIQYIAKGRSKGYIADSLFLSENTVKSYTKKAYAKLNIHSKQELLGMLGVKD